MAGRAVLKLIVSTVFICAAAVVLSAAGDSGSSSSSSSMPRMGGGSGASSSNPAEAYRLGRAALDAHNYHEAVGHFRTALRDRNFRNDPTINFALGLAYIGDNDYANAVRPLEVAARSPNPQSGMLAQLGIAYMHTNQRDKAVEQQTALTAMVNACDATCGDARRAQIQAQLDALTAAINAPPTAAAPTTGWNFPSEADGRAAYAEAVGLINQQHYSQALVSLERARDAIGPNASVFNYMGFASRRLGRTDDALAYYRQALAIDPNHRGANEYLGELYIQMGRIDDARRQLARLDHLCAYGCAEREELAHWIELASN